MCTVGDMVCMSVVPQCTHLYTFSNWAARISYSTISSTMIHCRPWTPEFRQAGVYGSCPVGNKQLSRFLTRETINNKAVSVNRVTYIPPMIEDVIQKTKGRRPTKPIVYNSTRRCRLLTDTVEWRLWNRPHVKTLEDTFTRKDGLKVIL